MNLPRAQNNSMNETTQENSNPSSPINNQPVQTPLPSTPTAQKNRFPLVIVILGILLILCAVSAGAFFVLNNNAKKDVPITQVTPTVVMTTTSPSPTITTQNTNDFSPFATRNYQLSDKIFDKEPYPSEMTGIPDSDLVPISCSKWYQSNYNGTYGFYDDKTKKTFSPSNELLAIVTNALKTLPPQKQGGSLPTIPPNSIDAFWVCKTQAGQQYIEYESWAGGGGTSNISYIGSVASNNSVELTTSIPNDGAAYFGCRLPFQITKSNILYLGCGGGDGGAASASVYRVNLTQQSTASTRLIKCTIAANLEGTDSTIKCQ